MLYLRSFLVGLVFSISMISCSGSAEMKTSFKYELSQQAYQADLITPIQLQTKGNTVFFSVVFPGGGSYDKARFENSQTILQIILFDSDNTIYDLQIIYKLSGSISELGPGKYTLQIKDSYDNVISSGAFEIQ